MVCGKFEYDTAKPGIAVPVMGTDPCGLNLTPAESGRSHVTTDGWRLKSVNQSHAESGASTRRSMAARAGDRVRLALMAHLHCPVAAQRLLDSAHPIRGGRHPYAVVAVRESRVEPDRQRDLRHAGV